MITSANTPRRQQGVALFISLVLLLVLTIIGVSSVQTTSLEVRMSRNDHDTLLAFQSAESALRDAEAVLNNLTSTAGFDGGTGQYTVSEMGDPEIWRTNGIWSGGNSAVADEIQGTAADARYVIEYMGPVLRRENAYEQSDPYGSGGVLDRVEMFRITALGVGGTENARVMLQSTFGRVLN